MVKGGVVCSHHQEGDANGLSGAGAARLVREEGEGPGHRSCRRQHVAVLAHDLGEGQGAWSMRHVLLASSPTMMAVVAPSLASFLTRVVRAWPQEGVLWWEERPSTPATEARSSHSEHALLPLTLSDPTPCRHTCTTHRAH